MRKEICHPLCRVTSLIIEWEQSVISPFAEIQLDILMETCPAHGVGCWHFNNLQLSFTMYLSLSLSFSLSLSSSTSLSYPILLPFSRPPTMQATPRHKHAAPLSAPLFFSFCLTFFQSLCLLPSSVCVWVWHCHTFLSVRTLLTVFHSPFAVIIRFPASFQASKRPLCSPLPSLLVLYAVQSFWCWSQPLGWVEQTCCGHTLVSGQKGGQRINQRGHFVPPRKRRRRTAAWLSHPSSPVSP